LAEVMERETKEHCKQVNSCICNFQPKLYHSINYNPILDFLILQRVHVDVQIENKLNNFFAKIDKWSDKFGITKANAFGYISLTFFIQLYQIMSFLIIKGDRGVAIL
jgi:hypothetical protein